MADADTCVNTVDCCVKPRYSIGATVMSSAPK